MTIFSYCLLFLIFYNTYEFSKNNINSILYFLLAKGFFRLSISETSIKLVRLSEYKIFNFSIKALA
jgi:hypothetical protein